MSGLLALILLKLEIHSYKVTHLVCYLQGVVSEKYVAFILNCINFSYSVLLFKHYNNNNTAGTNNVHCVILYVSDAGQGRLNYASW